MVPSLAKSIELQLISQIWHHNLIPPFFVAIFKIYTMKEDTTMCHVHDSSVAMHNLSELNKVKVK